MGLGRGVFRLAAMAAATIWLAGCMTAAVGPEHPGTRVRYKSPDPQKWIGSQAFGDRRAIFRCRPLACPELSIVSIRTAASPTRSPDRQALAKYASQTIPAAVEQANLNAASSLAPGRKIERLSSTATEIRGYPAISQEIRFVGAKEPVYMSKVTMFVKSALVDIASYSPSRETARRNRDLFAGAMQVEDIPLPR